MSHVKLPGLSPVLPLAGLMHLVLRKEKKVCLGEVVAALGKSGTQGNRRLGKTKTWENVRRYEKKLQWVRNYAVSVCVC